MKKNCFLKTFSLVLVTAAITSVALISSSKAGEGVLGADIQYIWDYPFTCENWYNSGKGFQFEFTYEKGTASDQEDHIQFCPMVTGDTRLTSGYPCKITVDGEGNVTSNKGNIIKNENGTYTYSMMFSDFTPDLWNTAEGINGTETVTKLYFRWGSLRLTKVRAFIIDSMMNVFPHGSVRDEENDNLHGLMFKAYIPSINQDAKYGMAIVPNEYLGKMTNNYCETLKSQGKSFVESYCNPLPITEDCPDLYDRYGGGYYIKCSLSVKENNYLRDFSAIAFEQVGNTRKYAWNTNEERDNLYSVCSRIRNVVSTFSGGAITYTHNVLNAVDNKTPSMSTSNVTAYVVDNTVQILKNQEITNSSTTLSFDAAKGETETGQIILKSTTPGTLNYFAGMSDLICDNHIITSDNVETSMQHYVNIISNWSGTSGHTSFLSDLYPGGHEDSELGYWPDALIPMHVAVRDGRNSINITNGANQGLFFRVNVPDNAVAGTYTGKVFIYIVGQGIISVPVSLNVHNFSIANRTNSNNIIILNKSQISALYGINYNNVCDSPYYSTAFDLLAERGISGGNVAKSWVNDYFDEYIATVKRFVQTSTKTNSYLMEFNQENVKMNWTFRTNTLSGTRTIQVDEDVFTFADKNGKKGLTSFLRALFDESTNECDLLKGAVLYDPHADEPSTPSAYIRNVLNFNVLRCAIDKVLEDVSDVTGKDSVKQSLANVFYLMTAGPEQSIAGSQNEYAFCDVKSISTTSGGDNCCCSTLDDIKYRRVTDYCPNMMWDWESNINWKQKSYKDDSGNPKASCGYCYDELSGIYDGTESIKRMWEYTCVQPVSPYPSYTLNTPMIRIRANRWRQVKLNIAGFMYYMANRTHIHVDDNTETLCNEEQILNGQIYYSGASSDGLLMYPVYNTFNYADRNIYWLSSLRLENTAESNDDVNYLYLAKELIAAHGNQASDITRLNNIYNSLNSDTTKNCPSAVTTSSSTFKTARNNLIALIEDLL